MVKSASFVLLICYGFWSCEPVRTNNDPEVGADSWNNIVELTDKGYLGKPQSIPIKIDSLNVIPAKGKAIHVNSSGPTRNELLRIKAGKPSKVRIDTSKILEVTPGSHKIALPEIFRIPRQGMNVQNGDTVRPPEVNRAYWPKSTPAQSMRFRDAALHDIQFIDVEQGLPSSYVDAIYEDRWGNIWFGTYGGGVTRYNGNSFTTFTIEHGLPNNIVRRIYEDNAGNLWFGTDGSGISRYDGSTFTNYGVAQGFPGIYLESITEEANGNIWFCTDGRGVSKYSKGKEEMFTNYTVENGLAGNNIYASLIDTNGILWFGTRNGLSRFDGKSFKNFTKKNGLPSSNVRSLFQDRKGNLWIGTEGGACIYDGESFINYTRAQGLLNHRIWHIDQDLDGNIWLGTDGGGVCKMSLQEDFNLEDVSLTFYTQRDGLSYDFIRSMYADDRGNMWFGIDGGGVAKLRTNSFTSFTANKHLSANSVWSITQDKKGAMWFGSDVWGIYQYEDGQFVSYMDEEGLLEYSVMDMLEDQKGNKWFATYGGGVIRYDGQTYTSFDHKEGFPNRDVYSMLEDKNGTLWFGTQGGGLVKYDGTNFTAYGEKDGLLNDRVWNIHEGANGVLWVGTFGGGVSKFDGTSFTNFTVEHGLLNNSVNSILQDRAGNLWLGTDEGVNKVVFEEGKQEAKLYSLSVSDGLVNNIILSLLEDHKGTIWIGTEGGISSLSPLNVNNEEDTKYRINNFVQSDGLKGLDVVINSVCLDDQQRIWWGTGKGLTMLEIDKIELPDVAPKLELNGISIQQEFVDFRKLDNEVYRESLPFGNALYQQFDSMMPFQNYPRNLALPHDLNHISFQFSAIDWNAPHKLKYQYMLEGQDERWSNLDKEAHAEYRNLGYGDYVFQAKAIGAGGIWSNKVTYPFTIVRPWWHSWWARLLYLIFGVVGLISFDRWRTYRILKNQRALQRSIEERNRELEQMVAQRTAEIKRQQEITEEANQVLEQKVKERTKELLEKNEKLAEYAFVNAHNLRVPVANIKGIIQLFDSVKSKEEKSELIEMLKGQSNSLDNVLFEIKEMLERDNYR